MAGKYGADVEQLRDLAQRMSHASENLDRSRLTVGNQIKISAWVGPFATSFKMQWESEHSKRIAAVVRLLEENAEKLRSNAEEQERASAADSGARGIAGSSTSGSVGSAAQVPPKDTAGMVETLHGMSRNDGILVQKILGDDGVTRYVVYINGTESSDNPYLHTIGENWSAVNGRSGSTDNYLATYLAGIVDPPDAEVMVMGYSQGGMHAELLAQSGRFNVTDVVTLYSPEIYQRNNLHGANVLRLSDVNQEPVSNLGAPNTFFGNPLSGGLRDLVAHATGEGEKGIQKDFLGTSDTPDDDGGWGAHRNQLAQKHIAQQFDESQNSEDLVIRSNMARYQNGTVTEEFD